jgi:HD-like signal output (HDOD) protein
VSYKALVSSGAFTASERQLMANPLTNFLKRWFDASENNKANVASETVAAVEELDARTASVSTLTIMPNKSDVAPVISTKVDPPEKERKKLVIWRPTIPVDADFFHWMMGHPSAGNHSELEQKVLQALYGLLTTDLSDAVLVPRMPSVIPQLLASLRNKSISAGEISRHIVKDIALVGAVIKAVNSAMYNPADRISSLEKAVMILGEDGLRLLIAKVAFNPIINVSSGHYTRRAAAHIWEQSEKCAVACHFLASEPESELDPFQAFLTGLMKNMGVIISLRVLDQVCEEPKFKYSPVFHAVFSSVAATLSYRIAQRWEFPPYVVQALQQQTGGSKPIDWTPLGHLLHTTDLISKMRVLVNHGQLMANDERLKIGLPSRTANCFDHLNQIQLYDLTNVK